MSDNEYGIYLGIDFGTTASAVGYVTGGISGKHSEPKAIRYLDKTKIPTAVYYPVDVDQAPLVGVEAMNEYSRDPRYFFTNFKRDLCGTNPIRTLPNGQAPRAQDLAELVFRYLKEIAASNELPLQNWVICHPVGIEWQKLVNKIASNSGLEKFTFLSEPLACLYYANYLHHIFDDRSQLVLLIDFGGGTCDLFLLRVKTRFWDKFIQIDIGERNEPLDQGQLLYRTAAGEPSSFGGMDIDRIIIEKMTQKWQQQYPKLLPFHHDLSSDPKYVYKFIKAARTVKERLSTLITTASKSDKVAEEILGLPRNTKLHFTMTKTEFEQCVRPLLENTFTSYLSDSDSGFFGSKRIRGKDVDRVILTGGSSNLPWLKDIIAKICPKAAEKNQINLLPEPEMSVAYGAAIYNYYNQIGGLPVPVMLEESLKVSIGGRLYLLAEKNSRLPYKSNQFRSTHYIHIDRVDDSLSIALYAGEGATEAECRQLGEKRVISFEKPLKVGRPLTYQIQIDQLGQVEVTIFPYMQPELCKKIIFEPLNVW